MSSEEEPVAWLRNEIEGDYTFAVGCLVRPFPGSDMDAIRERVADCKAKLAILDEHRLVVADRGLPEQGQSHGSGYRIVWDNPTAKQIADAASMWHNLDCPTCRVRFPCRTVRLLGGGYRHRPGYKEEDWKQ